LRHPHTLAQRRLIGRHLIDAIPPTAAIGLQSVITAPAHRFPRLTDAAPLVLANEMGLFARHGLQVELQREIGWATIPEK